LFERGVRDRVTEPVRCNGLDDRELARRLTKWERAEQPTNTPMSTPRQCRQMVISDARHALNLWIKNRV
jgi:hypothetical protein